MTGVVLGVRYSRRRLLARYALETYYGISAIGGTDPWRQMVLLTLAASVFLSSNPQQVYAGTPVYDPVFYYYHPDHLGSSQLMTDRDGDVVQQYGYSPFGRENYKNNTQAFSVSDRYTGQTLDEETGLYYYGARYYDPELARFIQADPIVPKERFSQALNRYAYCYNNPLRFIDPSGNIVLELLSIPVLPRAAKVIGKAVASGLAAMKAVSQEGGNALIGFIGGVVGYISGLLTLGSTVGLQVRTDGMLCAATTLGGSVFMGYISFGAGFVLGRYYARVGMGGCTTQSNAHEAPVEAEYLLDSHLYDPDNDPSDAPIVAGSDIIKKVWYGTDWEHFADETDVFYDFTAPTKDAAGKFRRATVRLSVPWELNPNWRKPSDQYYDIVEGQPARSVFVKYRFTDTYTKGADGELTLIDTSKTVVDRFWTPGTVVPYDFKPLHGTVIPWKCSSRDYFLGDKQPTFAPPPQRRW